MNSTQGILDEGPTSKYPNMPDGTTSLSECISNGSEKTKQTRNSYEQEYEPKSPKLAEKII